jgi:phosphoenolpyruvate synthase/pyruvate phosphate dikinase
VIGRSDFVRSLDELSSEDARLVGVSASSLAEMRRKALPVSDAFVVTTRAFELFSLSNGLAGTVGWFAEKAKAAEAGEQGRYARMIEVVIRSSKIPDSVRDAILLGYSDLRKRSGAVTVLARSSYPAEVSPDPNFMGDRSAFFDLMSDEELLAAVKRCWASVYNPSAFRLWSHRIAGTSLVPCAVVVQEQASAGPDLFGGAGGWDGEWPGGLLEGETKLFRGLLPRTDHYHR